jgi:uncharacterized membrane protein YraQ (UPF0718 family)
MQHSHSVFRALRWRPLIIAAVSIVLLANIRVATDTWLHISLPNWLQDFLTLSTSVLIESLPFVILGIILSVIVQLWLPPQVMTRWLPKQGLLRRLYVSCFGVFLPVCECGNVPLARGLVVRGFTPAEALTFLLAAPILNPITLITTHQAFQSDTRILIARAAGALIIANVIGWLFSRHPKQEDMLTPAFAASCKQKEDEHHHGKSTRSFQLFTSELGKILPALCIGALAAGLIQVLVPREVLLELGSNPALSILVMMALAFIIAICSNVDAFFALAFSGTFSVGSIVSFLVFGPMIDIKMLGLMRTTYRTRVLVQVTILVALMSIALGLAVNYAF